MKRSGLEAHSVGAVDALLLFLRQVVLPDKRARYLDLVSRPKSRRTFLNTMHHELVGHLDPTKQIDELTPELLQVPGYLFSPYNHTCFGEEINALTNVVSSVQESFLAVSADGRIGIHGPEAFINGRRFYAAHRR